VAGIILYPWASCDTKIRSMDNKILIRFQNEEEY
jgi:hypothetical protein